LDVLRDEVELFAIIGGGKLRILGEGAERRD
jgi:hypothetical protein